MMLQRKRKITSVRGMILSFGIFFLMMMLLCVHSKAATSDSWVESNGKIYYYNSDGQCSKGLVMIQGETYYFDKKGVQRIGWQKIKKDYYFFAIKDGAEGTMQKNKKVDGIVLKKNGKAKSTKTAVKKLKIMVKANKVVEKITNTNMTKSQKLRKCFDYTKKKYGYKTWRKFSAKKGWDLLYAGDMFYKGKGNCFSYGAAFAYMANAIGYDKVYAVSSGGHGWAEINGKVYDPDWALVSKVDDYFAMSYKLSGVKGRPQYKKNRAYAVKL